MGLIFLILLCSGLSEEQDWLQLVKVSLAKVIYVCFEICQSGYNGWK